MSQKMSETKNYSRENGYKDAKTPRDAISPSRDISERIEVLERLIDTLQEATIVFHLLYKKGETI
jgi:hypothetical protein